MTLNSSTVYSAYSIGVLQCALVYVEIKQLRDVSGVK